MLKINVIDSHTGGEPTRIITGGGPDLGNGPMAERVAIFREKFDHFRSAVVNEPRGSDVIVGGLLCEPTEEKFTAGIIFFNNTGYLGMCGHGTIGLMVTLKHLGKIQAGSHWIETPVGPVEATLRTENEVSVTNVDSYRHCRDVTVEVPDYGPVTGDVAWGGNWFFLVKQAPEKFTADTLNVSRADRLTNLTMQIRKSLERDGVTGLDGPIDHVELFGEPGDSKNHSRNFVLCPGGAYDRSPCGTGTSAKLACLAADGKLKPGETWRQEGILGSVFSGSYETEAGSNGIKPTIAGSAFLASESVLLLDENDPFCMGIRS